MSEIGFDFPQECTIERPTLGEDNGYGGTEAAAPETVATRIECFVQNVSSREADRFLKREMSVDIKIYFKTEPALREGDVVLITKNTAGASYVGQRFDFKAVDDATAGFGIAWKAFFNRQSNPVLPVVEG